MLIHLGKFQGLQVLPADFGAWGLNLDFSKRRLETSAGFLLEPWMQMFLFHALEHQAFEINAKPGLFEPSLLSVASFTVDGQETPTPFFRALLRGEK